MGCHESNESGKIDKETRQASLKDMEKKDMKETSRKRHSLSLSVEESNKETTRQEGVIVENNSLLVEITLLPVSSLSLSFTALGFILN